MLRTPLAFPMLLDDWCAMATGAQAQPDALARPSSPAVAPADVRRHARCAGRERGKAKNVMIGARKTSRSLRQSRINVTISAPIRTGCACRHRRRWGGARLCSRSERGTGR